MSYRGVISGICNLSLYKRHRIATALAACYSEGISRLMQVCHVCNDKIYEDGYPYSDFHKCYIQSCRTHVCGSCWKLRNSRYLKLEGCYYYMCPLHDPVLTSLFDKLWHDVKVQEYSEIEANLKN